eukprot:1068172-Karenia_brevis.AAC.1
MGPTDSEQHRVGGAQAPVVQRGSYFVGYVGGGFNLRVPQGCPETTVRAKNPQATPLSEL